MLPSLSNPIQVTLIILIALYNNHNNPNITGAQGEFTGLNVITAYHQANGDKRTHCIIPVSAHGTNPASAVINGLKVVPVKCNVNGEIDMADLKEKAEEHKDVLHR